MAASMKSSAEWMKEPEYAGVFIMDPDGWDRLHYHFSFNVEPISRETFEHRVSRSTHMRRAA